MKLTIELAGKHYQVDHVNELHLAIPLNFNGEQPNTYDVQKAISSPYQGEGYIGSVAEGGACNFESYQLVPHCNGTHTECIGHLSKTRINVHKELKDSLIPSVLITILPEKGLASNEDYLPEFENEDMVITKLSLSNALKHTPKEFLEALVIRTLPNDMSKMGRHYPSNPPAFFSHEAMQFIHDIGVKHLLVDLPSVDRTFDDGLLSNHRIFWEVALKNNTINKEKIQGKTITEMIYVPDEITDGLYLLNLQMAAFMADASPSRPILYPLNPI